MWGRFLGGVEGLLVMKVGRGMIRRQGGGSCIVGGCRQSGRMPPQGTFLFVFVELELGLHSG